MLGDEYRHLWEGRPLSFVVRLVINAIALLVIAQFAGGVQVAGIEAALVAAVVLGVVNATLRPLLVLLTIPINLLSLGLFTFVINALMLLLVSRVVTGFEVKGFWQAMLAAFLLSIVSGILNWLAGTGRHARR
jgi:putative membrane protein